MPDIEKRIHAFAALGEVIRDYLRAFQSDAATPQLDGRHLILHGSIEASQKHNPWFIKPHLEHALSAIGEMLTEEKLSNWIQKYELDQVDSKRTFNIGVIMAGNIPAVGFHDFLCVLMTGAKFTGKLSSGDPFLIPALAEILLDIDGTFAGKIEFEKSHIIQADAIIATGSNNTARYFERHYGRIPHIFRRNRNGVAVLTGSENEDQLQSLAHDIFIHFGLGCRNVSKLYLPLAYDFSSLTAALYNFSYVLGHEPYMNNYNYNKALLTMQNKRFTDNGILIMLESNAISSQIAILNYEFFGTQDYLSNQLVIQQDQIQCVVSELEPGLPVIGFGETQQPRLNDYADGVDTMKFLTSGMSWQSPLGSPPG
jgi:hypothetical protein